VYWVEIFLSGAFRCDQDIQTWGEWLSVTICDRCFPHVYTGWFMNYGRNSRRWFPRFLWSKNFMSTLLLFWVAVVFWQVFFVLVNALLWNTPTRKVTLNKLCIYHSKAGDANTFQACLLHLHARYSQLSGERRFGLRARFFKSCYTRRCGLKTFSFMWSYIYQVHVSSIPYILSNPFYSKIQAAVTVESRRVYVNFFITKA
jgi:hypothetical protein